MKQSAHRLMQKHRKVDRTPRPEADTHHDLGKCVARREIRQSRAVLQRRPLDRLERAAEARIASLRPFVEPQVFHYGEHFDGQSALREQPEERFEIRFILVPLQVSEARRSQ